MYYLGLAISIVFGALTVWLAVKARKSTRREQEAHTSLFTQNSDYGNRILTILEADCASQKAFEYGGLALITFFISFSALMLTILSYVQ